MTDKKKKNKIVDILLDFYDEYQSNEINRPMIPSIYAGKILDSMQEEPVGDIQSPVIFYELTGSVGSPKEEYADVRTTGYWHVEDVEQKPADWLQELHCKLDSLSKEDFEKVWAKYAIDFNKESVSEDLEEELSKLLKECEVDAEYVHQDFLHIVARHFANWQKEQMMSKAIEGDITFDYYGDDNKTYGCIAHNSFCLEDFGLKDRDKVKVIVIKEN